MATYNIHSLRIPFRVAFLIKEEIKKDRAKKIPSSFNGKVVEILMKHFKKEIENFSPKQQKEAINEMLKEDSGNGKR